MTDAGIKQSDRAYDSADGRGRAPVGSLGRRRGVAGRAETPDGQGCRPRSR